MLLPAGRLPCGPSTFSLLSLNVLIPNSVDGWWIYKMYAPGTSHACTTWFARSKILSELVLRADADVVMLQECSAESFASDFGFMAAAGYSCALHAKGRMRPATFWKQQRFAYCQPDGTVVPARGSVATAAALSAEIELSLAADNEDAARPTEATEALPVDLDKVYSRDRTLLTPLKLLSDDGQPDTDAPPVYFVNAHLAAGPEAPRRLRQVHEALETVRKVHGASAHAGGPAPCVVAGDFNSQGHSAVRELLCAQEVLPDFRESGDPTQPEQSDVQITSKPKRQRVGTFVDAHELALGSSRPPTLVAPQLKPRMQTADGALAPDLAAALDSMFDRLSADGQMLSAEEQERWLLTINRQLGRGSEYRAATKAREARGGDLIREDFINVYVAEAQAGKFWGIEHDLNAVLGAGVADPSTPPFTAVFDYIYFTEQTLRLEGVQDSLYSMSMPALPNEEHPSDHLPVAAVFSLR